MSEEPAQDLPAGWQPAWPKPRVSIARMLEELRGEAARRIAVQTALVNAGELKEPCDAQLAGALAMYRAARFIEKVAPYIDEVRGLIHRLQERGPRS